MNQTASLFPVSPRPELDRILEYVPGMSLEQIRRQYGLTKVIKLASNENPLGPSPKGVKAYKAVAENLFRYPDSRGVDLRRLIAEDFRRDVQEVIIGAGSDEIIELLAKAYLTPSDEVVVSESSFLQYRIAAELMGARVISVPQKNLRQDLLGLSAACTKRTKFVFIANPNNPTGTYNNRAEVEAFLLALPANVVPVFDEAYYEYAQTEPDYPSIIEEFFRIRPMVVLRTFSKAYGLAGLRVGYGVAHETFVRTLDKIKPPFNVSVPAQAAAAAAFLDEAHIKRTVKMNSAEKAFLAKELSAMNFTVVPSAANFLLFQVKPWTGRLLFERLLRLGFVARSVDEYGLPEYLRVTVGQPKENKLFLKALREVVNGQ
jgi:histidinol-phosphate aminotransferase